MRLESYESEEHQKMVRSLLNGRFENTAFCVLAPDGETRLSGTGRSPSMGLRSGGRRGPGRGRGSDDSVITSMNGIAKKYRMRGDAEEAVVQDFHTFRQALNVASGDQRLLFLVLAPEKERAELRKRLRRVFADSEIVGRFHTDFAETKEDAKWHEGIKGVNSGTKAGMYVVRADAFGQSGKLMTSLPIDAKEEEIKGSLLKANRSFASDEERKVYRDHVSEGRREGIFFENGMPYGEDRDGDGKIDHRGGLNRRGPEGRGPRGRGEGRGREGRRSRGPGQAERPRERRE